MKLNKPSLILFFFALLCTIIFDWTQQEVFATYSKAIVLPAIFIYGFYIFVTIYSCAELMDKSKYAVLWEGIRFASIISIIIFYGDWFGLNGVFYLSNYIILAYAAISFLAAIYFVTIDFRSNQTQL